MYHVDKGENWQKKINTLFHLCAHNQAGDSARYKHNFPKLFSVKRFNYFMISVTFIESRLEKNTFGFICSQPADNKDQNIVDGNDLKIIVYLF